MDNQESLTILDYWRVAWRARWGIVSLTVVSAAVSLVVGWTMPKVYTARITAFFIPGTAAGASTMAGGAGAGGAGEGLMSLLARVGGGSPGGAEISGRGLPPIDVLLKSRTVKEQLLAEFARKKGRNIESKVVSIAPDMKEKGVIALTVEATEAAVAADLANHVPDFMSGLLEDMSREAAHHQETVYQAQLKRAAKELDGAERQLLAFQSENRVLVSMAAKDAVETGANLRGNIMALELQREVMLTRFTREHPQVRELDSQIAELKRQYSKNLYGDAMELPGETAGGRGNRREFFVAASKLSPIQFAFLKQYRTFKFHEAFYTAAMEGFTRLQYEGMTFGTFRVLDSAVVPGAPSRPNVPFIVAAASIGGLIAGLVLAFFADYVARVRAVERRRRLGLPARSRSGDGNGNGSSSRILELEPSHIVEPETTAPTRR